MPKSDKATKPVPEKKIGPYRSGIGGAVWLNTIETQNGPKQVRSFTLSPRRYYDERDRKWKDAGSFRPIDLPTVAIVIQEAIHYVNTTPLPGTDESQQEVEDR